MKVLVRTSEANELGKQPPFPAFVNERCAGRVSCFKDSCETLQHVSEATDW